MLNHNLIILGFDFGMKRIGVAIGQTVTNTATAITILKAQCGIPNWEEIKVLVKHWRINVFVVGVPYNMDGSEQPLTFAARKFSQALQVRFKIPSYTVDERLTTIEAKRQWYEQKMTKKRCPKHLDNYSAKLILEQWLRE